MARSGFLMVFRRRHGSNFGFWVRCPSGYVQLLVAAFGLMPPNRRSNRPWGRIAIRSQGGTSVDGKGLDAALHPQMLVSVADQHDRTVDRRTDSVLFRGRPVASAVAGRRARLLQPCPRECEQAGNGHRDASPPPMATSVASAAPLVR